MQRTVLSETLAVSFWALLNALSSRVLNLVTLYIAARSLNGEQYGSLALMMNTAQSWSILIGAGLGITLAKYVAQYRGSSPAKAASLVSSLFSIALLICLTGMAFAIKFSSMLAADKFYGNLSANDVVITAAWTSVLALSMVMQGAVSGYEAFRQNAMIALIAGLFALAFVGLGDRHSREWVMTGLILGNCIALLLTSILVLQRTQLVESLFIARKTIRFFDSAHLALVGKFGVPAFISGVVIAQSQWHANVGVSNSENGLDSMAGLSIALQWYAIIQFIPGVISNSMLPVLSRHASNAGAGRQSFNFALVINVGCVLLMSFVAVALRTWILGLYGDAYKKFADAFLYLVIAAALSGSSSLHLQKIASAGRGITLLGINLIWAVVFFVVIHHANLDTSAAAHVAAAYLIANGAQAAMAVAVSNRGLRTAS